MAKVLGKLEKKEMNDIENIQKDINSLQTQQEICKLRLENVNLKLELQIKIRSDMINNIKQKYAVKDLTKVIIKDTGEVIDITEIEKINDAE